LTLKVCSTHIGPDQDFFEFFVILRKIC